ncbi:MAG: hypothetical protein VKJ06_01435 [Vampirovibrionales bacterium]|nr:hypothetical protein [Vampirovibrionales bacterium]
MYCHDFSSAALCSPPPPRKSLPTSGLTPAPDEETLNLKRCDFINEIVDIFGQKLDSAPAQVLEAKDLLPELRRNRYATYPEIKFKLGNELFSIKTMTHADRADCVFMLNDVADNISLKYSRYSAGTNEEWPNILTYKRTPQFKTVSVQKYPFATEDRKVLEEAKRTGLLDKIEALGLRYITKIAQSANTEQRQLIGKLFLPQGK